MNRILCFFGARKSRHSQIINAIVWAVIMIVTALVVDLSTINFMIPLYIAGWFATTFIIDRNAPKK